MYTVGEGVVGGKVVSVAHADHIWAILEAARQSASVSIASEFCN